MQIIDNVFDEFILECKLRKLANSTIRTYKTIWKQFIHDMDINELSDLTSNTMKRYTMLLMERGLAGNTINSYLRHLRTIFYWMADEEQDLIPKIKVKMVKASTNIKPVFTQKELKRLLAKPKKDESFVTWRCWLTANIFAHTGMRGATLLRVKWTNVSLQFKTMKLNHTKTDARLIPLSDELVKVLLIYKRMFKPSDDFPLISMPNGKELKMRSMQQAMKFYHNARGVEVSMLHQYRRTFITNALVRGVDSLIVARMVGHKDLQLLHKHYLPHQVELLRRVVE